MSDCFLAKQHGIIGGFSKQVRATPNRLAVVDCFGSTLTYGQLYKRMQAIAAELKRQGVMPGNIVPVIAGRTCDAVATKLATLLVGAAIMPIDADLPSAVLNQQLKVSGASICLLTEVIVTPPIIPVIDVQAIPTCDIDFIDPPIVDPDDLAYVISTSGSTGIPKVARNSHRALTHLVDAITQTILAGHGIALRTALVAPWAFDPWIQQLFPALLRGDTVYIVDDIIRRDGRLLAQFYYQNKIQISDGTPSHLRMLTMAGPSALSDLPVLHFIIGGESMLLADICLFFKCIPALNPQISNIYGVAECAVDSLSFTFNRTTLLNGPYVPVGSPLGETYVSIHDNHGREVLEGEIGELCIGGPGVGAGYLGDPESTAHKFVARENGLVYSTGDLARQLPDGTIEILGRLDHQVKIADKRVDLGQIESALHAYRPVRIDDPSSASLEVPASQCKSCIQTSGQPGLTFDDAGVCSTCRSYEKWRGALGNYWKQQEDFYHLVTEIRRKNSGPFDCLLLFSGGKDSTYVLHRLHQAGLRVHTWTFDNGFISDEAFVNIERTTRALGVTHVTEGISGMNDIFATSLRTNQTVCDACFRALTTLGTRFAATHDIPLVITGLSRGQIVQTKLEPLLEEGIVDPTQIEGRLVEYRKMYHRRQDSIHDFLGVSLSDDTFDRILFVDYFRFDSAIAAQIIEYLKAKDSDWCRPGNTGFCSTNCRINDAGIAVHQAVRGYHNYAAPLSWDVRLGLMSRDDAMRKVSDPLDNTAIGKMLLKVGYQPRVTGAAVVKVNEVLAGFFTADQKINQRDLRSHLERQLPRYAIPARLYQIDVIPVNHNGKIDIQALTQMDTDQLQKRSVGNLDHPVERVLVGLWREVLGHVPTDTEEDFFDAGGTSMKATILLKLIEERFDDIGELPLAMIYDKPTVKGLAQEIEARRQNSAAICMDGLMVLKRRSAQ